MSWSFRAFSDFHQELMAAQHAAMAIAVKVQVAVDLCGAELNDILEWFMDDGDDFLHFLVVMGVVVVGDADEQGDEDAVYLFHLQVPARNAGRERQVQMPARLLQVHPGLTTAGPPCVPQFGSRPRAIISGAVIIVFFVLILRIRWSF